jgi:hypothetical protein
MRKIYLLISIFLASQIEAQEVIGFENFELGPESFLNGSGADGGFQAGNLFLHNTYDSEFMFWTGWAISNTTDVTTPGFMNQYSSNTGGGLDSENYAVAYVFPESVIRLENDVVPQGVFITNSTYATISMQEGDAFAKKFGGLTGNDPDFFLLTIKAYQNGELSEESVEFFLADYTFEDNSQDYIIDDWTYVDLTPLGEADSLSFTLTSSDVGEFGMNTPAYFCIDDFVTSNPLLSENTSHVNYVIFPNPTTDLITIQSEVTPERIAAFDLNGRLVREVSNRNVLDLSLLANGNYAVRVEYADFVDTQLILKK